MPTTLLIVDDHDAFRRFAGAMLAAATEAPLMVHISSRDAGACGRCVETAPVPDFLAKRELSGDSLAALLV